MPSDAVQKIKDRLSIIDVISPYVELHNAGKNMKGKSPFTTEKTPSFYVSPDRGMYYCFSSAQGGDMFTFIQKMEGVDFKGALKILADRAGVELIPENPETRTHRDNLYNALEEATKFFEANLENNKNVSNYLYDRAVTDETIKKWRLGYSLNDWRTTKEHLNAKGFKDDILIAAGLIKQVDAGKQPYDVFRDRVMFPIMDASGRVVGFSGRIFTTGTDAAKYLNSPETELFNKSEIMFGYDKAKHGIHKLDFSLIVEGQFDVVLSHQAGYHNAVAVSGTALTPSHVSLLQRLSNRVVLALDADKAGINAVKRAANIMLPRAVDLKVARLHGGKDPADLVKEDPKLLKKDIGSATHVIEFLLDILKDEAKDERMLRVRTRDEILPYVLQIDSNIEQDYFAGLIAEKIGTTVDAIRLDLARLKSETADKQIPEGPDNEPATTTPNKSYSNRKEDLIAYIVSVVDIIQDDSTNILVEEFTKITKKTIEDAKKDIPVEKISEMIFSLERYFNEINPRLIKEEYHDKLSQLKSILNKEAIQNLRNQIQEAESAQDENKITELLAKLNDLKSSMS